MPKKSKSTINETSVLDSSSVAENHKDKSSKMSFRKLLIIICSLLIAGGLVVLGASLISNVLSPNPVPQFIKDKVSFKVYYPLQAKLPAGYVLDKHSFSASQNVVLMTVDYGQKNQIIFSEQPLPKSNELQTFYSLRIPLRTTVNTSVGQAAISGLNGESFVSLPAGKTWIIITAPNNSDQSKLKQVLLSIRQA
jgi:hypothetical protein